MKINRLVPVVSTEKLTESKDFYTKYLQFQIVFANDWYVLLESQNQSLQIAFVMPNHETQPLQRNTSYCIIVKNLVFITLL